MNAYGKLYNTEINISIIIFSICFFASCNQIPKEYKSYQTFDEYLMKGVNDTNYVDPHVAIKAVKDTIFVIIIGDKESNNTPAKYIHFGNYWYSKLKDQPNYPENCGCDTTPKIRERFFFSDTIMEYSYYFKQGKKSLEELSFQTKKGLLILSDSDDLILNNGSSYQNLKRYVVNYRKRYEHYFNTSKYQKRYYQLYRKQIHNDTLYLYEDIGNILYKYGDVTGKDKLSTLGEFGVEMYRAGW